MQVLIKNGVVESYPYSIGNLRKDNPNVSFPKNPSPELMAQWGVYPVQSVGAPGTDHTQNLKEGQPVNDGGWKQTWIVTQATEGEIAERTQSMADGVRGGRDDLLVKSDWTQVADAPVDKAAWATYRQALRDITTQPGFPWDVQWPVAP
jgi:hypothetical protein